MMPPIKDFDRHNRLVEGVRQSILEVNAMESLPYMVTRAVVVRSSETVRKGVRRAEVMEVAVRTEPRPGSRMGRLPGVGTLLSPLIRRTIAGDDGEVRVVDIRTVADDPEAVAAGVLYLRACCSVNSLAYAAMYALDSFAQATGAPRLAAVNALLDAVVVRVGLAAALVPALGYPGILAAQALSPVLPCAVGAAYLRRYARRVRSETGIGAKAAS